MHEGLICVKILTDAAELANAWSDHLNHTNSRRQVFVIPNLSQNVKKGWAEYFSSPQRKDLTFVPPLKSGVPFSVHVNTRDIPHLFQMLVKTMLHLHARVSENLGGTVFVFAPNLAPLLAGYGISRARAQELLSGLKTKSEPKRSLIAFDTSFSSSEYFFDRQGIVQDLQSLKQVWNGMQNLARTPSYDEGPVPEYDAERLPDYMGGARRWRRGRSRRSEK